MPRGINNAALALFVKKLVSIDINKNTNIKIESVKTKPLKFLEPQKTSNLQTDQWEEASIEDIRSGKYQAG